MFKKGGYGGIVDSMKKKIVLWSISGIVALALAIVLIIVAIPKSNADDDSIINEEKDDEIVTDEPTIEPFLDIENIADIFLHNDGEPYTINIKVTCNEEYIVSTSANNDNILITDNIVTPNKVGKSIVKIDVKSASKEVIKYVNIEVLPSSLNASFTILKDDAIPSHLFVGEEYVLQLDLSKKLIYNYDILTSENIENFQLISKENTKIKYKFKIENNGEIIFNFKYKDYAKTIKNTAFDYVSNINVAFSREFKNGKINLFLFNNNYVNLANNDDIFNEIGYTIINQVNVINDYSISVENPSIVQVSNNKISAQNEGSTKLIFKANDGSNYEQSYQIDIAKVNINDLGIRNEEISLNINDTYTIPQITLSPIYAIANIVYYYDNYEYTDEVLTFETSGTHQLKIVDTISNLSAIITFKIKEKGNLKIKIDENFMYKKNATFEDDVLTVTSAEKELEVNFSCILKDADEGTEIDCAIDSSSDTITIETNQTYNGYILILAGKGIAHFTLTLKNNPTITYSFDIVIN